MRGLITSMLATPPRSGKAVRGGKFLSVKILLSGIDSVLGYSGCLSTRSSDCLLGGVDGRYLDDLLGASGEGVPDLFLLCLGLPGGGDLKGAMSIGGRWGTW